VRRQPNNRVQTLSVEVDAMPLPTEITVPQLVRIIGLPNAPLLVDVRTDEEFKADPRVIPTARRHDYREKSAWVQHYLDQPVIVIADAVWPRARALPLGYVTRRSTRRR
jgi:hypothetical protein